MPHTVQNAHGTTVRCRNCKIHARQLDFKRTLEQGVCVPIVGTGVGLRSVSGGVSVLARSSGAGAGVGTSKPAKRNALEAFESHGEVEMHSASVGNALVCAEEQQRTTLLEQPPQVGRSRLHPTHHLDHCRGIIICRKCGYYVINKAKSLVQPCQNHPTKNTGIYLVRWLRGDTPKAGLEWPETFDSLPSGIIWKPR